jgi:signal transduction histidine kinase
VVLEVSIPSGLPVIRADGVRLLRVLDNLLANALRHTPPGGLVRLSGALERERLAIRVEDTGEGMPPEVLAHLFERYYRGDSARTRAHEGSGLGLAIARAIARAHGGDLTAESAPREGSTLTLTLPLA